MQFSFFVIEYIYWFVLLISKLSTFCLWIIFRLFDLRIYTNTISQLGINFWLVYRIRILILTLINFFYVTILLNNTKIWTTLIRVILFLFFEFFLSLCFVFFIFTIIQIIWLYFFHPQKEIPVLRFEMH